MHVRMSLSMDASRLYTIIRLFFRVVTLLGTVTIRNPGAIPVSLPPPIPLLVGCILILDMNSAGVTRTFRRRLDTSTNMYMLFSSDTDIGRPASREGNEKKCSPGFQLEKLKSS